MHADFEESWCFQLSSLAPGSKKWFRVRALLDRPALPGGYLGACAELQRRPSELIGDDYVGELSGGAGGFW
jgi:hypothetical protein